MKRLISLFLALLIISTFSFTASASDTVIYVAENGSDTFGNGSSAAPFATLAKAKAEAAKYAGETAVTVSIAEGTYYAETPLKFFSSESGAEGAEITFKGEGEVIVTGSKKISAGDFNIVSDPMILPRLKKEVRGKVYSLDLSKYELGVLNRVQLFLDGKMQSEARYPNSGYVTVTNTAVDGVYDTTGAVTDLSVSNWATSVSAGGVYCTGSFGGPYFWAETGISEVGDGEITFGRTVGESTSVFVSNLIEEIDAVGEYAVYNGILFCYLPEDFSGNVEIINPTFASSYITISNASHINFENIIFDKISANTAIELNNADYIDITDCEFNYIQSDYVVKVLGQNVNIKNNNVYGCRGGFVQLDANCGDAATLTPGNVVVSNNRILNCGNKLVYINYIIGGGSNSSIGTSAPTGNEISYNEIGNCSTVYAISLPGARNKVINNEIYNVGRQITDGGAIYFGRSSMKRGNEVAYNYIHHLRDYTKGTAGYSGIYLDDGYGGINVHHNVFYDMYQPMLLALGMDVKVTDNIAVDTHLGILWQSRMGTGKNTATYNEMNNFLSNYARKTLYEAEFPELIGALERTPAFAPYNSQISGNVFVGSISSAPFWQSASGELETYGAKVTSVDGTNLNGTAAGNPVFSTVSVTDYNAQNFNLTSAITESEEYKLSQSTAGEVDMTKIGINASENPYKNAESFKIYPNYVDGKLVVKWDKVENASRYTVVLNSSETEIYDNNLDCAFETAANSGEEYQISVIAEGIARQNPFTLTSDVVNYTTPVENDLSSLNYALSVLKDEIDSGCDYTDSTMSTQLSELYSKIEAEKSTYTTVQAESAEAEIYTLLTAADVVYIAREGIVQCEAVDNSTMVKVKVEGFEPYTSVTVLVTNPSATINDVVGGNNTVVRYTNVVSANRRGIASFNFDTSIKDVDMPGVYEVYATSLGNTPYKATYAYGTVETGDITYTVNNTTVSAADLKAGDTVKASIPVTNRCSADLTPAIVCGVYSAGGKLLDLVVDNAETLSANNVTTVELTFNLPSDYTANDRVELMIMDSNLFLKPLTTKRVLVEAQ